MTNPDTFESSKCIVHGHIIANDQPGLVSEVAIYALAEKGNAKALPYLKLQLRKSEASPKIIEAASLFGLPELYDELASWGSSGFLYEWARKRCSSDQNMKDSVDDAWNGDEWYLNVLHGVRKPLKLRQGEHL